MTASTESILTPVPESITFTENNQLLSIEKNWFKPVHIASLVFALMWNGFLGFFYSSLIAGNALLFVYGFTLLHLAAGLWLMYFAVCGLINKTVISTSRREITIKHQPLPWSGNRTIHRNEIEQLFVLQRIHSGKNTTTITYDIQAIISGNKAINLVKGLETPEEAKFIENKIEHFLQIEDKPVKGEFV